MVYILALSLNSKCIIFAHRTQQMTNRPVLAMNFYWSDNGNLINAYQLMKNSALQQKIHQQTSKKQTIVETFHQIQEIVNNFIPETKSEIRTLHRKNKSGPYTYDKNYFQKLDQNIKLINYYLQALEHQTNFNHN